MRDTRRRKRLVGWKQYARTRWAEALGYSGATAVVLCGVGFFVLCVVLIRDGFQSGDSASKLSVVMGGIGCGIGALLTLWYATTLYSDTRQIEPVALITRHNVQDLPAGKTLLRGSNRPPTDLQAELLRAAQGQELETPPDQLLRATQESGQDV